MSKLSNLLTAFNVSSLRPLQAEVLKGLRNNEHVMACLPTAYGKSLTYQLPAMIEPELTIVVSPLIATINDQVQAVNNKFGKLVAMRWHSEISDDEKKAFTNTIQTARLFYCSPESLVHTSVLNQICRFRTVKRVVIDEAHYVAQWGDNFRPAFKLFPNVVREIIPNVQWLMLTATATNETIECIRQVVCSDFRLIQHDPMKDNLRYVRTQVSKSPSLSDLKEMKRLLTDDQYSLSTSKLTLACRRLITGQKTLIFCLTRRRVELLTSQLSLLGIAAHRYHAGLTTQEKQQSAQAFLESDNGVLVATSAFGVGVDIPDIRLIIHVETPLTVDAYVQETGRAGRDGLPATVVYLHSESSHSAGNALLSLAYPNDNVIEKTVVALRQECAVQQGLLEFDSSCFEVDTVLDIHRLSELLDEKVSVIDTVLGHLVTSNFLNVSVSGGECVYRLSREHTFDLGAYRQLKQAAIHEFGVMKNYSLLSEGQEHSYLRSFYPAGRTENQVLKRVQSFR